MYTEIPSTLESNDTSPDREITMDRGLLRLGNTRMARRKQKYSMDAIPTIFSSFSAANVSFLLAT